MYNPTNTFSRFFDLFLGLRMTLDILTRQSLKRRDMSQHNLVSALIIWRPW